MVAAGAVLGLWWGGCGGFSGAEAGFRSMKKPEVARAKDSSSVFRGGGTAGAATGATGNGTGTGCGAIATGITAGMTGAGITGTGITGAVITGITAPVLLSSSESSKRELSVGTAD